MNSIEKFEIKLDEHCKKFIEKQIEFICTNSNYSRSESLEYIQNSFNTTLKKFFEDNPGMSDEDFAELTLNTLRN